MSTRGAIAIRNADGGWRGVWCWHDSYPSYLGDQLWQERRGGTSAELQDFAQRLLEIGNWAVFCNEPLDTETLLQQTEQQFLDSTHPDPLFAEWVYILDPQSRTLTVLHRDDGPLGHTEIYPNTDPILRRDGYWDYGHVACRHTQVCSICLDGDTPGWERIEHENS